MYRSLCIALVLFVVSKSTIIRDVSEEGHMKACKRANNVSDELYESLMSHGVNSTMTDPNGKCFVACHLEWRKFYYTDGTLSEEVKNKASVEYENGDEVLKQLETCAILPNDDCEKKFNMFFCIKDALNLGTKRKDEKVEQRN